MPVADYPRNVAALATMKQALVAAAQPAAGSYSLLGAEIDRSVAGWESALFGVFPGLATGSPTSWTLDAKLQHADPGGSWSDVVADGVNEKVAITQIVSAAAVPRFLAVDLSRLKLRVRLAFQLAFVGGTSPTLLLDAKAQVGGGVSIPPVHA